MLYSPHVGQGLEVELQLRGLGCQETSCVIGHLPYAMTKGTGGLWCGTAISYTVAWENA